MGKFGVLNLKWPLKTAHGSTMCNKNIKAKDKDVGVKIVLGETLLYQGFLACLGLKLHASGHPEWCEIFQQQ